MISKLNFTFFIRLTRANFFKNIPIKNRTFNKMKFGILLMSLYQGKQLVGIDSFYGKFRNQQNNTEENQKGKS